MKLRVLYCLLVFVAAACATTKKEPPPKPFAGTRWEVLLEREPMPQRVRPWFVFGDGTMEGFTGCNHVSARYVLDSVGAGAITMGRLDVQRGGCDPRAQIAETHILDVLRSVSSYSITGDVMKMTGSAGSITLRAASGPTS